MQSISTHVSYIVSLLILNTDKLQWPFFLFLRIGGETLFSSDYYSVKLLFITDVKGI